MSRNASHAALVVVLLVLPACGDLGGERKGVQAILAKRVEEDAVERYAADTPERTVLEWFRALQGGEAQRAAGFYAAGLAVDEQQIARASGAAPRGTLLRPLHPLPRGARRGAVGRSRDGLHRDRRSLGGSQRQGAGGPAPRRLSRSSVRGTAGGLADDLFLDTARELVVKRPKR